MYDITNDIIAGSHIISSCKKAVEVARQRNETVMFSFNGAVVEARPEDTPETVFEAWDAEMERLRRVYLESDEYKKAQKRQAKRDAEIAARAATYPDYPTFDVINTELYNEVVERNKDSIGRSIVQYAHRWAWKMEQEMAAGKSLSRIARRASHHADIDGQSGLSHGLARNFLIYTWKHGDALKRIKNI